MLVYTCIRKPADFKRINEYKLFSTSFQQQLIFVKEIFTITGLLTKKLQGLTKTRNGLKRLDARPYKGFTKQNLDFAIRMVMSKVISK